MTGLSRYRKCRYCRRNKQLNGWAYCSVNCENSWRAQHSKSELSAAEVDRILDNAVRMETAPPWKRHPQAWS